MDIITLEKQDDIEPLLRGTNGRLVIPAGVVSQHIVVSSGGEYISARVSGTLVSGIVGYGGTQDVFSGGMVSSSVVSSGGRVLLAGGQALDAVVSNGGQLAVRSYGSDLSYASKAQIYSGGFMDVYDSSTAEGTVIHAGGYVRVRDFGVVSDTLIESGASMYVHSSSGLAVDTVVSGFARVYDGATMSRTTIASGASFHLWRGGILQDADVQYGGLLDIRESAPILTGDIHVAGQLKVSYDQNVNAANANIMLDLAERSYADGYSIVNLDYLGSTNISIKVSADQSAGIYQIASRGGSWDKPISLIVNGESEAVSLSINNCLSMGGRNYILARGEDNAITLGISIIPDLNDSAFPVMSAYTETGDLTFGLGNISEFTLDDDIHTSGFVCYIGGFQANDWIATNDSGKPYVFIHDKVIDAEKKDTVSLDDKWCGEMTETNMLELTGHLNRCNWQFGDQFMAHCIAEGEKWTSTRPLSKIFENIDRSWSVSWGSFDRTGAKNTWLQQADAQLRSGNYAGWWQVKWGTPDNITGNHAMTLVGFTYDTSYSVDDPRYYAGVVLMDSDDNKWTFDDPGDAPNILKIESIVWDDQLGGYWFRDGKGFMENVWTIKRMDLPGAADLTWYQPNAWSSQMSVSTVVNATHDGQVLRTDDELLLNFAITNSGLSQTGKFYVSLYVDEQLKETFTVSSMDYGDIAAIQNYSIGRLSAGTHVISAVIDSHDMVAESYETNNVYTKTIEITTAQTRKFITSATGFVISSHDHASKFDVLGGARVHLRGENAVADDVIVSSGGTLYVSSGGILENSVISASGGLVVSGGIVSNGIIIGNQALIYDGGRHIDCVVSSGGRIWLAGGQAIDAMVSAGGNMEVRSYGSDLSYASGAQIFSGGGLDVYNSSFADGTVIHTGGHAYVRNFGVASGTLLESGALMYAYSSGMAHNTIVSGIVRAYGGGVLSGIDVISGGQVSTYSGGILKGRLNLSDGAIVKVLAGSILDFTVSGLSPKEAALVSNWSNISIADTAQITLTISSAQQDGIYSLASGMPSFTRSITVQGEDGTAYGTLANGDSLTIGETIYSLAHSENTLSLVVRTPFVPTITLTADTVTPLRQTTLTADCDNGFTLYYNTVSTEYTGNWQAYNGPLTVTANVTYYFKALDELGNVGANSITFTNIDHVAPVITFTGDNTKPLQKSTLTATTEARLKLYYNTVSANYTGEWTEYTGKINVTVNATYYFKATDAAGNTGTAQITFANIDTIAPVITLTGDNVTPQKTTQLTANTEAEVNIFWSTDNIVWKKYITPLNISSNGTWYFKATDAAGNKGTNQITFTNIDRVAPTISDIKADITSLTNGKVTVTASASDDVNDVSLFYSKDGGSYIAYDGGVEFTENGSVVFKAVDAVGNQTESAPFEVTNIDKVAPVIRLGGDNSTPRQSSTLTASTEPGIDIYWSTDNKTWTKYEGELTITSNGTYYFKATDAVGNKGVNAIKFSNIDTTVPVITLDGDNSTPLQCAKLTASTEIGLDIFWSSDNENWTKYESELNITSNGTYFFKATDAAGNMGTAQITFGNIDRVAPDILDITADVTVMTNGKVIVMASASDDTGNVSLLYSKDGGEFVEYTDGVEFTANILDVDVRINLANLAGSHLCLEIAFVGIILPE